MSKSTLALRRSKAPLPPRPMPAIDPGMLFEPDLQAFVDGLLAAGYQRGFPLSTSLVARAIDETVAQEARCPACRFVGLEAMPLHKPGSYRVLCVCPKCDHYEEL